MGTQTTWFVTQVLPLSISTAVIPPRNRVLEMSPALSGRVETPLASNGSSLALRRTSNKADGNTCLPSRQRRECDPVSDEATEMPHLLSSGCPVALPVSFCCPLPPERFLRGIWAPLNPIHDAAFNLEGCMLLDSSAVAGQVSGCFFCTR
jgi:hypothetical protein